MPPFALRVHFVAVVLTSRDTNAVAIASLFITLSSFSSFFFFFAFSVKEVKAALPGDGRERDDDDARAVLSEAEQQTMDAIQLH